LTDLGNARRLVRRYGHDLRYDHTSQKFYHFDGRRWAPDATGEVERRAKETVERIHEEALACQDIDRCSELLRWHKASQNKTKLRNMIELAKTEAEIAVTADQFDKDQFLLNVENGTLNLRNGELQPHRREDLITMLAPVEYDPDAEAPLFNDFLHTIFDGNEAYISFALRFFG